MNKAAHQDAIKMSLAIPRDVRAWLETRAAVNLAPLNATIVMTLRQQMRAEQAAEARANAELA